MGAAAKRGVTSLLKRLREGRYIAIFGLSLVLFFVSGSSWFLNRDMVQNVAAFAHDKHFALRDGFAAFPEVAIVGIKETSLDQTYLAPLAEKSEAVRLMHDNTWPWPRTIHARVIERLFEAGAKIVAVDIAFASERAGDEELVAVLKKYSGRIILASVMQRPIDTAIVQFLHPHLKFEEAAGPKSRGLVLVDGAVVRRYSSHTSEMRELEMDDGVHDLVHFAARSVELYTGQPVSPRYMEVLPFQGKPATFDYIPVEEIFMDAAFQQGSAHFKGRDVLRDKLVFYGPIAEIMHDVHMTPLGVMPGVEIHAHLASALIKDQRIIDASPLWAGAFTLAVVLICALLVLLNRNPLLQALSLTSTLVSAFVVTHVAFRKGVFFPIAPGLLAGFAAGFSGILYLFIVERLERAQVRKVFGRFVSKRIAEVVLKNADEFETARAGERRSVAVLFSDIRSFTTWSENAAPENLVGQLNEYFERMVPLIEDTEGNAQKFIGDAILAAWGDTHSSGHAEDCRRAVVAALKMRTVLSALNTQWHGRADRITISIGVGINHGSVVTGEVGHSERREFTVLGDGVNFAARLESATKQFHTDCLVGESVEALTRGQFIYREVGYLRVKGKTKPVHIYTPLSDKTTPAPEWLADFHRALTLHRTREFTAAVALFAEVKQRAGGEDFLCNWYTIHAQRYLAEPPPEDWDGSETLTEK